MIWVRHKMNVPVNLSANNRQSFFPYRKIYQEAKRRELIDIYAAVPN